MADGESGIDETKVQFRWVLLHNVSVALHARGPMAVPVGERFSEFGRCLLEGLLRSLASSSAPNATRCTTGYRPDGRSLTGITGDGSYGQPSEGPSGGPSDCAASGGLGLTQRGPVSRLELRVSPIWIPTGALEGPVKAHPLVRRLRLCGLILGWVDDHFGRVGARRRRLAEGG